jgi:hypothetical protein
MLLGCHDLSIRNLPLSNQIEFLRRKMAARDGNSGPG